MKRINYILALLVLVSTVTFANDALPAKTSNVLEVVPSAQDPIILPVGTILFLRSTTAIQAPNFRAGDHFFVELEKDVTSKGKVVIPKGTIVQMEVLVSENKKRKSSTFGVTVGGFIIDNYLRGVKTEAKMVTTEGKAGSTAKKGLIGAGIGAAFGGSSGAGKGAAVGAGLGMLEPGTVIRFPAGTSATFQLEMPLKVDWL